MKKQIVQYVDMMSENHLIVKIIEFIIIIVLI